MAQAKQKSLKTWTAFTGKQRVRFAAYPFAYAYAAQYDPERDAKGKIRYELARDRQREPKLHKRTGKPLFKLDRAGKKIPVLDENAPQNAKDGQIKKKKVAQLPWGFVVKDTGVRTSWTEGKDKQVIVYAECRRRIGGAFKRNRVWIREDALQDERCLEVSFVDIGQGDGCFLVTPEDKRMVIDAGESDNMRRYLNWRHGTSKETSFETAIISHPDSDHYKGFEQLFYRTNFEFETVYTNGLMEGTVPAKKKLADGTTLTSLGPKKKVQCDDGVERTVVTRLVTNLSELDTFLKKRTNWITRSKGKKGKVKESRKQFPSLLDDARNGKKATQRWGDSEGQPTITYEKTMHQLGMLSAPHKDDQPLKGTSKKAKATQDLAAGYMPNYAPRQVYGKEFSIKVLGPVTRRVGGKPAFDWLESVGKTKNGHSVVLLLQYGHVKMLLGGDLNIPSEELLLSHHTGMRCPPEEGQESAFLEAARKVFQVDVAKSCHHGSSDFTEWFLRALNPIATVISSGDNEPHSHPRSDTLGAIGRHSRSNPRPLIFSTELARSSKDAVKEPWKVKKRIRDDFEDMYCKEAVQVLLEELARQKAAAKTAEPPKKESKKELRERLAMTIQNGIEATDDRLDEDVARSVAVYGTITVVTDGERVIIYQKLERKGSHGSYDIYRLEPGGRDTDGNPAPPLMYQSKH